MKMKCEKCKYFSMTIYEYPCSDCERINLGTSDHWEQDAEENNMELSENVMSTSPETKPAKDNVNHPAHYESSCSLECIEAMEIIFGIEYVYAFCVCNAWKYIWRYKNKNGIEDLEKARWYINKCLWYDLNDPAFEKLVDMALSIDKWLLSHNQA